MQRFVLPLAMLFTACLSACAPSQVTIVNFPLNVRKERTIETPSAPVALAWSPDGSKLTAAIDWGATIVIWDQSGRQISRFSTEDSNLLGSLALSSDGVQVLSIPPHDDLGRAALMVRDWKSGNLTREIPLPVAAGSLQTGSFEVSPDHRLLAVVLLGRGTTRPDVALFETATWRLLRVYATGGALPIGFFDQGREFIIGTVNNQVAIYDTGSNRELRRFPAALTSPEYSAALSAVAGTSDGTLVFGAQGDSSAAAATVYRALDGTKVASFPLAREQFIRKASWDPQDRYLALVDNAGQFIVWRPLAAHLSYETFHIANGGLGLAVSPDGRRIAVASVQGVDIYRVA